MARSNRPRRGVVVTLTVSKYRPPARLTRWERRVLRLVSLDCDEGQIARVLRQPLRIVRGRLTALRRKAGSSGVAALTRFALASGASSIGDRLTDAEWRRIDG